jgi:hypothetical protein
MNRHLELKSPCPNCGNIGKENSTTTDGERHTPPRWEDIVVLCDESSDEECHTPPRWMALTAATMIPVGVACVCVALATDWFQLAFGWLASNWRGVILGVLISLGLFLCITLGVILGVILVVGVLITALAFIGMATVMMFVAFRALRDSPLTNAETRRAVLAGGLSSTVVLALTVAVFAFTVPPLLEDPERAFVIALITSCVFVVLFCVSVTVASAVVDGDIWTKTQRFLFPDQPLDISESDEYANAMVGQDKRKGE